MRGHASLSSAVMRLEISPYSSKLALNCTTLWRSSTSRCLKAGAPIGIPSAFASADRATKQPSLLLSTTTGLPSRSGRKKRSQLTKKLLQSTSAKSGLLMLFALPLAVDCRGNDAPNLGVHRQLLTRPEHKSIVMYPRDQVVWF